MSGDEVVLIAAGEGRVLRAFGGRVTILRGQMHTFKSVGEENSRKILSTAPAGFEVFFTRCGDEWAKESGPDMRRIFEIVAEHGIHFVKE